MEQVYRIAGMTICLQSLTDEVCDERLNAYRTDCKPDFTVRICPEDIERERRAYEAVDRRMQRPHTERQITLLEFKAFHRKIVEQAPFYHVFSFHGSAIAADGQAYIFAAPSGTGKSTHTRLWREVLGEKAVMINDDKPMLRVTETEIIACGTPWNGKHKIGNNIEAPVKAFCFIERSENNRIHEISKAESYPELIRQIFRPDNPLAMAKILEMVAMIHVPFYRLGCNMDPEAVKVAYEGMK